MSSPLEFVRLFHEKLSTGGIQHLLTSGMACVHYGVQQLTKDSDWIINPGHLGKLRELLGEEERGLPPWRVAYRGIFGAPLEAGYLEAGWTSHLSIWPGADSVENHADFFGKPPRLRTVEYRPDGWASRDSLARMKKTDRAKDWPIVNALGLQAAAENDFTAVLHLTDVPQLKEAWARIPDDLRAKSRQIRPLLHVLAEEDDPLRLERLVLIETTLWQMVNKERYGVYQSAWKAFYRRWREVETWGWPTSEPFARQHERLLAAAKEYALPLDPLNEAGRDALFEKGRKRTASLLMAMPEELEKVCPAMEEMLP